MEYVQFARIEGRKMRGHLETLRGNLEIIKTSSSLTGRAKDAIVNVITNQHVPLAMGLENVYWKIGVKAQEMVDAFLDYMDEPDEASIFHGIALMGLRDDMVRVNDEKQGLDNELRLIYNRINDIISLSPPSTLAYEQNFGQMMYDVDQTMERLATFTFNFSEIEELVEELRIHIRQFHSMSQSRMPIDSPNRQVSSISRTEFASRMIEMHSEFARQEQLKITELYESWRSHDHRNVNFYPKTKVEREAWESFWDSAVYNFDNFVKRPVTGAHGGVYWLFCRQTGEFSMSATAAYTMQQLEQRQQNMGGTMEHVPSPFVAYHRERLRTGINPETGEPLTRWERMHSRGYLMADRWLALTPAFRTGMMVHTVSSMNKPVAVQGRSSTLPNGRIVQLNTINSRVINGNIKTTNAPHLRNINDKWVRSTNRVFLPNRHYTRYRLPSQVPQGVRALPKHDQFGNLIQIKFYDEFGRQSGWVDFTNHGHPKIHTVPHWHEVLYSPEFPYGKIFDHRLDPTPPFISN